MSINAFPTNSAIPLNFGGVVSCGLPGDELSSGYCPIYTDGRISKTFALKTAQSSIQVSVCAIQVNSPSANLVISLYNGSTLLTSANLIPSQVRNVTPAVLATDLNGWTSFVTLTASLVAGTYYTIRVTSPSSTSSSYFQGYMNFYTSFTDPNATANYTPPTGSGLSGFNGSPVLWIKDSSGNNLSIFPLGISSDVNLVGNGTFIATSSYQINCLVPWLSDMEYLSTPYTASFVLTDTTNSTVVGTGNVTQAYNSHGIQGLQPIQFLNPVNIVKGHSYSISITETGNAASTSAYPVLIRGSFVNPAIAGPGGSAFYWYGQLGLSDYSQYRILDYGGTTTTGQNGHGGIGGTDQVAVRIVPTHNETITSVKLKTCSALGCASDPTFYTAGTTLTLGLYASNESYMAPEFAAPTGSAIATATIDSGSIPKCGQFTITTSFTVTSGTPYWLVWSAPTAPNSSYDVERCVSPYRNLALASQDSGTTWSFFGQGPTDLAFAAISSLETLGNTYDNSYTTSIDSGTNLIAQPFILTSGGVMNSVFVNAASGIIQAQIFPDNGLGTGPNISIPLGGGTFNTAFQYFYSGVVIPFSTLATLSGSTKYWIVYTSYNHSTIQVATYWSRPATIPSGYDTLASSDGGLTWHVAYSEPCTTLFAVGLFPSGATMPLLPQTESTILALHGQTTYGVDAYGEPFEGGYAPFTSLASAISYYQSQGINRYPWQDGSNGYTSDLNGIVSGFGSGAVLAPLYGWGYNTQFYNLGRGYLQTLYPAEQEFYLSGGVLSPATGSGGLQGIVIDAPELTNEWIWMYGQLDANVGLQNFSGIAGWQNSDHGVNYGGAQGHSGGHNMNTYTRYVNSPLGYYLTDVNGSGIHNSDSTYCALWPYKGKLLNYGTTKPSMTTGVMIPLYTSPTDGSWTNLIAVKNANPRVPIVAIINPSNGPGISPDGNFVTGINNLRAAGITVAGYVYTSYGARSVSAVEADMNSYKSWYNINAILFDEFPNVAGYEAYYTSLTSYAQSLGFSTTIGGAGTGVPSTYIGTVSIINIYESSGLPSVATIQGFTSGGARTNFALVAYAVSTPTIAQVYSYVPYVSWVYYTDNNTGNPYNTLSTYIGSLVADFNIWATVCFSRVYQTYPEGTANWFWTGGAETTTTVANALKSMAPTYVSGMIRIDTTALPLPSSSPNVVGDYTTIRNAVIASYPNCKFDVVIRTDQYATPTAIANDMTTVAGEISFDIFWLDAAAGVSNAILSQAITTAHSLGKIIIFDYGQSVVTPPTGYDAIASTISSNSPVTAINLAAVNNPGPSLSGSTLSFLQGLGVPILLHGNNFDPDRSLFTQTFTLAQRQAWLSTAYELQSAYGFYLMYSVLGPWQAPINTCYDAIADGTMPLQVSLTTLPPFEPPAALATDVQSYHHGGGSVTKTSSFSLYCAAANANLEYQLLLTLQSKAGPVIARTAMPLTVIQAIPAYYNSPLVLMASSLTDPSPDNTTLSSGGLMTMNPYYNFANCQDNSSNSIGTDIPCPSTGITDPGYGVSNPTTTFTYWTNRVPTLGNHIKTEADTDPLQIQTVVNDTSWVHFGRLYGAMPFVGDFYGNSTDSIRLLSIGGYLPLSMFAHQWASPTLTNLTGLYGITQALSSFNCIFGTPADADCSALTTYITNGGTAVIPVIEEQGTGIWSATMATLVGVTATSSGSGEGSLTFDVPASVIWKPYATGDIGSQYFATYQGQATRTTTGSGVTVLAHNNNGPVVWTRTIGSGTIVCFVLPYGNAGFTGDGLSAGFAYLMINAILHVTGNDSLIPAIYLPAFVQRTSWANALSGSGQGSAPPIILSILGTPTGQKLLWYSNTSTSTKNVSLGFSNAFFNFPSTWQAYNQNTGSNAATGSGDAVLNLTIPIQDWTPLYMQAQSGGGGGGVFNLTIRVYS